MPMRAPCVQVLHHYSKLLRRQHTTVPSDDTQLLVHHDRDNKPSKREVPVIKVSPAQIRAFQIADNRLTENSEWDKKLLGEQLRFLSESELDLDLETTGCAV